MRALVMFGALLGLGLGLQVACHGACADTGSHDHCCSHNDCNCASQHCATAESACGGASECQILVADYECTVAWVDEDGVEIDSEIYLYENFENAMAVTDTCNSLQAGNSDQPDEAADAACTCERTSGERPVQLSAPS